MYVFVHCVLNFLSLENDWRIICIHIHLDAFDRYDQKRYFNGLPVLESIWTGDSVLFVHINYVLIARFKSQVQLKSDTQMRFSMQNSLAALSYPNTHKHIEYRWCRCVSLTCRKLFKIIVIVNLFGHQLRQMVWQRRSRLSKAICSYICSGDLLALRSAITNFNFQLISSRRWSCVLKHKWLMELTANALSKMSDDFINWTV